jgi:AcrR family transcriptional regulator
MRTLAAEAGCATGLPYKVFSDRQELVMELVRSELDALRSLSDELRGRAGSGTVSGNLSWYADKISASPAVALVPEVAHRRERGDGFTANVHTKGVGPADFESAFTDYLAAEQNLGRVSSGVDTEAFGFVLAGAIHNLIIAGESWPRPTQRQLKRRLAGIAAAIAGAP